MTIIRRFVATAILAAVVMLTACAPTLFYYQYKDGESDLNAAKTKCALQGERLKQGVSQVPSGNIFNPTANAIANLATDLQRDKAYQSAFDACLAELGWLPCSEGGTAEHGCPVEIKDGDLPPLHLAAKKGRTSTMRHLLVNGADIEEKVIGKTALRYAIVYGRTNAVLFLIEAGADVETKNNKGGTPLMSAAIFDKANIADILIKAGANVNAKSNDGLTPLHVAGAGNSEEVADILIKAGADVNARANNGDTPLMLAEKTHGVGSDVAIFLRRVMALQGDK